MPLTATIPAVDFGNYTCRVLVDEQSLPDAFQLLSVQVKQAYQHITSATLLLKQPVEIADSALPGLRSGNLPEPGKAIRVVAVYESDEILLFDGFIVKLKYKNSNSGTRLQLIAKTKTVKFSLNTRTEVFAGQNDKEIIESIVSGAGCILATNNLVNSFQVKHTQLVKNGLSDWDFINIRAEANGCFLYTEGHKVVLEKPVEQVDPVKIITAQYGQNVFSLEMEQDSRQYAFEEELVSFNLASFENETATEEETEATSSPVQGKRSGINYRTFNDLENSTLVQASTQLKNLSRHNGLVQLRATLEVKPGYTLRIAGFNSSVNGDYIITSVMQDYSEGGFSTWLQVGLNQESYSKKFHLSPSTNQPLLLNGLVTALEGDPDNLHRIQVKIAGWQQAQEPLWARLATPYAGDQYGLVLLPEIGDEVVVAFMGTDFDVPVVLGAAFSPNKPPHTDFKDDNYKKILITKKGMKWAWDDEKGVHEISTPNGNKILISEDEHAITITDENSNKIEMNQSAISLTGSKDINIKAATNVKIEGALVEINASGNLTLKGSIVMIN